jgi:hypothetical protein
MPVPASAATALREAWCVATSGDQCVLGPDNVHSGLARVWCRALDKKHPAVAKLGDELMAMPEMDLFDYLHPDATQGEAHALSEDEWSRRAVAAWYAILKHGIEHGDTLAYC